MAARPFPAVPFIINNQASPIPVTDLDTNFAQLLTDFNDSAIGYVNYAADIGIANAYVLNLAQAPSAYVQGLTVAFVPQNSNGAGASTINVNSLGGVNITDANAGTPQPGMIKAGMMVIAVYDGTQFRIVTLTELSIDLGNMAGTPSLNCAGYKKIWISANMNGINNTLTLTNLNLNTDLQIYVIQNNAHTLKISASTPASVNYTIFSYWNSSGGGFSRVNMTTTGWSAQANTDVIFRGVTGTQGGTAFLPLVTQSG